MRRSRIPKETTFALNGIEQAVEPQLVRRPWNPALHRLHEGGSSLRQHQFALEADAVYLMVVRVAWIARYSKTCIFDRLVELSRSCTHFASEAKHDFVARTSFDGDVDLPCAVSQSLL